MQNRVRAKMGTKLDSQLSKKEVKMHITWIIGAYLVV